MSRLQIQLRKKAVREGISSQASPTQINAARDAALWLLRRSVAKQHDRLAILRLTDAVRLNAVIDDVLWDHCQTVASLQPDSNQLHALKAMRRNTANRFFEEPAGTV